MKFGEKLRDLRKKDGLTQAELAEKAGISLWPSYKPYRQKTKENKKKEQYV